jgi:hypothetical protein
MIMMMIKMIMVKFYVSYQQGKRSQDSAVGIETGYKLYDRGVRVQECSLLRVIQTVFGAYPPS